MSAMTKKRDRLHASERKREKIIDFLLDYILDRTHDSSNFNRGELKTAFREKVEASIKVGK